MAALATYNYAYMRFPWAGLILLLIAGPVRLAMGQVSGEVESIGFDNHVRPDCWTPMVVKVTPETSKTDFYQIRVKVQDMDRDLPVYTRTISITGAAEGQSRQQRFRMYFMPPPTDGGIPDWNDPNSLRDLQDRVKVSIHSNSGKWICDLGLTSAVHNLDPRGGPFSERRRGTKLVLAINEGRSTPIYKDPVSELLGVMEDVAMVTINPRDLPEKVLGYESVDYVAWFDADPAQLKAGGDEKFRALQAWVRRGGKLVICQPTEWQKVLAFEDLLPVVNVQVEEKNNLQPLTDLARPRESRVEELIRPADPFAATKPPYRFARATPRQGAIVDEWITWTSPQDRSPYIVRMPYGAGAVTWVAQDLGDPAIVKSRSGWIWVWDRVFDWKNSPLPASNATPEAARRDWQEGYSVDMGKSLLAGMDLQSKSAWLITLAVVFFVGYWLVAGPGTYTFLATRRRAHLSWFVFGLCAVAATGLTVVIVRLVLRGPPELKHFSIVRMAPDRPAHVISRFGLYIPRDGMQRIELKNAVAEASSSICPLPIPPTFLTGAPAETGPEYTVPIVDEAAGKRSFAEVPYRSTLKKFRATWTGEIDGSVQGSGKLLERDWIDGNLTNGTGRKLFNVYIAFNYPVAGGLGGDWMLYVPSWENGATLDLRQAFNGSADQRVPMVNEQVTPDNRRVRGKLIGDWDRFWFSKGDFRGGLANDQYDDSGAPVPKSLPIMSLFERLQPVKSEVRLQRIDLLRRGGRTLDISGALAAGGLVVLAEADGPLPIPMEVEGDPVTGAGRILYQFVLPLDRSGLPVETDDSTTQPAGD